MERQNKQKNQQRENIYENIMEFLSTIPNNK